MEINNSELIIRKFGTQSRLAALLGKSQSTIAHWAKTGTIPSKWRPQIIEVARCNGIDLSMLDFGPVQPPQLHPLSKSNESSMMAEYQGELAFGDTTVGCYVLKNGMRVISRTGAAEALTDIKAGGDLEGYLSVQSLQNHLSLDWQNQLFEIDLGLGNNKVVRAMTAETFVMICTAYVNAFRSGDLTTDRQKEIAMKSAFILASCANIGLVALIDEATGYQYVREEDALRVKLKLFLEEEMRKWEKTFPDELWKEFGRLTNWKGSAHQRPKYWGKLVNELVYSYLDPDVYDWLKANAPKPRHGQNYHLWMSEQYGLKKLIEHLWMLVGMGSACRNMAELRRRMAEKYGKQPVQLTLYLDVLP